MIGTELHRRRTLQEEDEERAIHFAFAVADDHWIGCIISSQNYGNLCFLLRRPMIFLSPRTRPESGHGRTRLL
jgi:hypothetical protein